MYKELVSVIVPVFNVEKYLRRCVTSIINQDYLNLEILLIDDGSTDNSGKICDLLSKEDERIKVFHKKNGGLSDARNYGIKNSHGKYLLFVDSDDFISKNLLKNTLKVAILSHADIVQFSFVKLNENKVNSYYFPNQRLLVQHISHQQIVKECLNYQIPIVAWNKLYKRRLFKNLLFPVGEIHEDEATVPYLIDQSRKYVILSNVYYAYVQRNGSIMHNKFNSKELVNLKIMHDRIKYFNKKYNYKYDYIMYYHALVRMKELIYKMNKDDINNIKLKRYLNQQCTKYFRLTLESRNFYSSFKAFMYYLFPSFMLSLREKKKEEKNEIQNIK